MSGAGFKDHFSAHAGEYAAHRPRYPAELFEWLARQAPGLDLAWDCATGSGQAAVGLAPHFRAVVATDASREQLRHAAAHPGVEYRLEPAERTTLADRSVDLVTVGQALHWLDHPAFFREVARVLRLRGVFAAWAYQLILIDERVDCVVGRFYKETLRGYWLPERRLVERGYRDIEMPFDELPTPGFYMKADWSLAQFCGYLRTWSAVRRYLELTGSDPVDELERALLEPWGETGATRTVTWPLKLRVGVNASEP